MAKRGASHRLRRLIPGTHPARRIQVAIHPEVLPLGLALPSEPALAAQNGVIRIAFVASAVPRRCGIATFTADLMAAVKAADPAVRCIPPAIDEPKTTHPYAPEARSRIRPADTASYRAAARSIDGSSADLVNLQPVLGPSCG